MEEGEEDNGWNDSFLELFDVWWTLRLENYVLCWRISLNVCWKEDFIGNLDGWISFVDAGREERKYVWEGVGWEVSIFLLRLSDQVELFRFHFWIIFICSSMLRKEIWKFGGRFLKYENMEVALCEGCAVFDCCCSENFYGSVRWGWERVYLTRTKRFAHFRVVGWVVVLRRREGRSFQVCDMSWRERRCDEIELLDRNGFKNECCASICFLFRESDGKWMQFWLIFG